ncbi:MAG: GNAT family N-acetyltransferase [Pseudonocardiaceae bacterium]
MTTDRVRHDQTEVALRPDADRVHEWASMERACRYQPWGPNTREQTHAFVADAARTWEQSDGQRRVFAAESATLGVFGIGEIKRNTATCAEIAYAVHIDLWGRGLGTQIARVLVSTAFANPAVERVQGTCDPRNVASAAVLRRAGFIFEGTLQHTVLVRDGWRDSAMLSVLRHEWTGQQPQH